MLGADLADRIRRGEGIAAQRVGAWCDLFRPTGGGPALADDNRIMRLPSVFLPARGRQALRAFGEAAWRGIFDAAYTRPGDYLMRRDDGATWFVASCDRLIPSLCIRAERMVDISRAVGPAMAGANAYGGASTTPVLTGWPASVVAMRGTGMDRARLPADGLPASWIMLLPALVGTVLRTGDLVRDDLGRTGLVGAAEVSDLGWRMIVKQTAA